MKQTHNGEFDFIGNISTLFSSLSSGKYEGIGDDCAVIPINSTQSLVVTTDMLVERSHFILDKITPYDLGWKSLAVNLSDIAGMGAKPIASFMSIALSSNISLEWKEKFLDGYYDISKRFSVELLGGDTTASKSDVAISITAIGIIDNKNIKRRNSAIQGDIIATTATIGDSGCGLKLLLNNLFDPTNPTHEYLEKQHHHPTPHLEEGRWLSEQAIGAMMDISDGISSDLEHICSKSNCGAEIEIEKLPISAQMTECCEQNRWDIISTALCSGEDYCLLITIPEERFNKIAELFNKRFKKPLNAIGRITNTKEIKYLDKNSNPLDIPIGFRHF